MQYKYKFGDSVYVKTDKDQNEHIVSGYLCRPGSVQYLCKMDDAEGCYYDFELSNEQDMVKKTA